MIIFRNMKLLNKKSLKKRKKVKLLTLLLTCQLKVQEILIQSTTTSRSISVRPLNQLRDEKGCFALYCSDLRRLDPQWHLNYFRMSKEKYDVLLGKLGRSLDRKFTCSQPISPDQRLAFTLRLLISGGSQVDLAHQFRVGRSTAHDILYQTCDAIVSSLKEYIPFPSTREEWILISKDFEEKWNFPLCLGALDGKHIRIMNPKKAGSLFYNHKHFFSIVLLAMCDANYKFLFVDVGGKGSNSDATLFQNSDFGQLLQNDENPKNIPSTKSLRSIAYIIGWSMPGSGTFSGTDRIAPYVFIGDEGFPLKSNVMRPIPGRNTGQLTKEERIFNYRLSRARRTIENTFGILASRFRIFRREINMEPEYARKVVMACCTLHNYLMVENKASYAPAVLVDRDMGNGVIQEGEYRRDTMGDTGLVDTANFGCNSKRETRLIRDSFMHYFMNEGKLPWQEQSINPYKEK